MGTINLRQMKIGQKGAIQRVDADSELGRRIRDMGLIPGKEITIQGGNAPCITRISKSA